MFCQSLVPLSFHFSSAIPLLDNLIKALSPLLKAKSTMDESLDFSLS